MRKYHFESKHSVLYLPQGGTTKCTFWSIAALDLDVIQDDWVELNLLEMKERLRNAFFELDLNLKHISIEISENEIIAYTTGGTRKGMRLYWKPRS